jgi:hypothetical protein
LIFLPTGVGLIVLIIGLVNNDPLLTILDADGSVSQDALSRSLAAKYPAIDDANVTSALAQAIRAKAAVTTADAQGRKTVTLGRDEVMQILAPTGLAEINPAAAEQIVRDLQ